MAPCPRHSSRPHAQSGSPPAAAAKSVIGLVMRFAQDVRGGLQAPAAAPEVNVRGYPPPSQSSSQYRPDKGGTPRLQLGAGLSPQRNGDILNGSNYIIFRFASFRFSWFSELSAFRCCRNYFSNNDSCGRPQIGWVEIIWDHLGLGSSEIISSGVIWYHLRSCGVWDCLGPSGIWDHPGLESSEITWSGLIWYHLGSSGILWTHLGSFESGII